MRLRDVTIIGLVIVGVVFACVMLGWWAGRAGAQRMEPVQAGSILGIPAGTPPLIPIGPRIRIYFGENIDGAPAFTVLGGRVYRGDKLQNPLMTLEEAEVHSGGPDGPVLYRFEDNRVVEAYGDGPTQFTLRGSELYFGDDPNAPILFHFEGARVYRGDAGQGRILATANTVLDDPELMKLVGVVMFMQTLE